MKNKILKSCSFLVLTLLMAVVSAQAQKTEVYKAEIPFDFVIANKTFEAGNYVISLKSPTALSTIMTIKDDEANELQVKAIMKNGKVSKTDKTSLVFKRYGNNYILSRIASPEFGFNAPKSRVITRLAKKQADKLKTVSILLRKQGKDVD